MNTHHQIFSSSCINMEQIHNKSVALVITSPPYPMIKMWDEIFIANDSRIGKAFSDNNIREAFYLMHEFLNKVWSEIDRVLVDGGIVCINIGDATRTFENGFQVFSNHTEINKWFFNNGYSILPDIIWHKPTNSPNKFMGSGMLPCGAYVTYEHEYILVFRKGDKREFKTETDKSIRQQSSYFWEERNKWFSDIWDVKGTKQSINNNKTRERSGAFPIEIPYRLINMYSIKGDIILDPFSGTGTTIMAAMASERNSIGYEIDNTLCNSLYENIKNQKEILSNLQLARIKNHIDFINNLEGDKKEKCYKTNTGLLVKTKQEIKIDIRQINEINELDKIITCSYKSL